MSVFQFQSYLILIRKREKRKIKDMRMVCECGESGKENLSMGILRKLSIQGIFYELTNNHCCERN